MKNFQFSVLKMSWQYPDYYYFCSLNFNNVLRYEKILFCNYFVECIAGWM